VNDSIPTPLRSDVVTATSYFPESASAAIVMLAMSFLVVTKVVEFVVIFAAGAPCRSSVTADP
jgi:hypothetical protein